MTHLRYILLLMLLLPRLAHAQFSFDIPSVEAYIADHKNQRSLLLARATLEQSNALLHDYSKAAIYLFLGRPGRPGRNGRKFSMKMEVGSGDLGCFWSINKVKVCVFIIF